MGSSKKTWINLGLVNLCVVALLGFTLRSKILFPMDFLDYRNILTAHGNFALSGWIGFVLMSLLVYRILPPAQSERKIYPVLLSLVFIFSWCMMLGYAFSGPSKISIAFSFLYIATTYVFAGCFINDILSISITRTVRMLCILSLVCLVLASSGSIALALMYMGLWKIPVSYRDASYIFLHFQYNGFFSLGIGALYLHFIKNSTGNIPSALRGAANWIAIATIPSVFLSLLYYERLSFYIMGGITGMMLLVGTFYFIGYLFSKDRKVVYRYSWARILLIMASCSFILKMIMQVGTLTPIGHEVYSDRPVIIGFLHMVFLAFASFFILGMLVEEEYFSRKGKLIKIPLLVFILGVLSNEGFLMIQGIEILLKTNNPVYNWLLWIASVILFSGALMIAFSRFLSSREG
jgi:hypothetical protein